MYDVYLFDAPQSVIGALHQDGRIVICYFSAGSYGNWRPDAAAFPTPIRGKALDNWPGESWLDIRQINTLSVIMQVRLDLAAQRCGPGPMRAACP